MSRFNLLEEPWIPVMADDMGSTEEVSLIELFLNAHKYKQLAGEMQMQNFAILRLLFGCSAHSFLKIRCAGRTLSLFSFG